MDSGPVVWSPSYEVPIGPHVFPTAKYRLIVEKLEAEGVLSREAIIPPAPASYEALGRVHSDRYLAKIRDNAFTKVDELKLEVPFSVALRDAWILCCGGTILTGDLALDHDVAVHIGGGFHHAFPGHGEGFCLLNDVAVACLDLLDRGRKIGVRAPSAGGGVVDLHDGEGAPVAHGLAS